MNLVPRQKPPTRLGAVLRQRCPRCLVGQVFVGPLKMNRACPECGFVFACEPGYFLGAMYFGYGFGAVVLGLLLLVAWLIGPELPLHILLLIAMAAFLPFVPIVFRYSRICWMHFDHV